MKITKSYLKQVIVEEIRNMSEMMSEPPETLSDMTRRFAEKLPEYVRNPVTSADGKTINFRMAPKDLESLKSLINNMSLDGLNVTATDDDDPYAFEITGFEKYQK